MRRTRPLALAAALSLTMLTGCGDDAASPTLDATTGTTETTESSTDTTADTTETTETTESSTDTTADTTATTVADGGTESAAAGDAEVIVEGFEYQPESISVEAGTQIVFENRDGVPHTVTAGTPEEPMPAIVDEPLPPGATATWTVDETGTIPYFCEIHPTMTAEVVVQ